MQPLGCVCAKTELCSTFHRAGVQSRPLFYKIPIDLVLPAHSPTHVYTTWLHIWHSDCIHPIRGKCVWYGGRIHPIWDIAYAASHTRIPPNGNTSVEARLIRGSPRIMSQIWYISREVRDLRCRVGAVKTALPSEKDGSMEVGCGD